MKRRINGKTISLAKLTDIQLTSIEKQAVSFVTLIDEDFVFDWSDLFPALKARLAVKRSANALDVLESLTSRNNYDAIKFIF